MIRCIPPILLLVTTASAMPPQTFNGVRGADAQPVIDPTENVKALTEAAVKRLDDLQAAAVLRNDELRKAETLRIDELRTAESRRVDEQLQLRADYAERLAIAEAKRIDAIRAVDVNAVAVASQRASDQATVLATQVAQSAEALRGLVATTATTVAASQQQLATTLTQRITTLEQASYQSQGKQTYSDPQIAEMSVELKKLREGSSNDAGNKEGISTSWAVLLGATTIGAVLFGMMSRRKAAH